MEEQVGALWHRLVTRWADHGHPEAAVDLKSLEQTLGILFRALGGDPGLRVEAADADAYRARRSWRQRLAGSHQKVELAWRDAESLRLPPRIDRFPDPALNRALYLWLAALAVGDDGRDTGTGRDAWLHRNQALARRALTKFPGLRKRYRALVEAHLPQRPAPERLPAEERAVEQAVRRAVRNPDDVVDLPPGRRLPYPVPLWLHPTPPRPLLAPPAANHDASPKPRETRSRTIDDLARRQAQRVDEPDQDRGLVTARMENIFTWGEFVNVDRGSEEEEDLERAEAVARDLDRLAVSRNAKASTAGLKFDLDLPSAAADDLVLDDGILLPEWDWKRRRLLPDRCRVVSMTAEDAVPCPLPNHLTHTAKRLRNQFQALAPARVWVHGQSEGPEVDFDAYVRFAADRAAGQAVAGDRLYRELRSGARDLVCVLLADLSLSTDTWIDDHHRVIDVIRDSLFLFAESLAATGDRFALYGFSSRRRDPVRVHTLKGFDEPYGPRVRGRIAAVKPGYYTRLGAGIRHTADLLAEQPGGRRLLLVLTDGKPNDLDQYEGRYGVEDTRHAVQAARRIGLQPFCVTIDEWGNDYLPYLFGSDGYVVVRHPAELPKRLPMLYARLTG